MSSHSDDLWYKETVYQGMTIYIYVCVSVCVCGLAAVVHLSMFDKIVKTQFVCII